MRYPFEVTLEELAADVDSFVNSVFATRIQHLDTLSRQGVPAGNRRFQVIACVAGRGFGVRREDMKKLLLATDGKVFTLKNLGRIVACSDLARLAVRRT